jgi:hypothetical protein
MEWYEIVVNILSGLVVIIPLVVELVKYIKKFIKEKNWSTLLSLIMNFMTEAEERFENGEDKKAYVLAAIEASSKTINYDIDMEQISNIIDNLCAMSKKVNAQKEVTE